MSTVRVDNIEIKNNPAKFTDNIVFEVTFTCAESIKNDVEWKLTYVGSGASEQYDQVLDSILVGPIPVGTSKFTLDAPAPDASKIPKDDLIGVTAMFFSGTYNGNEFVRVGYYVNVEYDSEELKEDPPKTPVVDKLVRNILVKPRVTTYPIQWDDADEENQ